MSNEDEIFPAQKRVFATSFAQRGSEVVYPMENEIFDGSESDPPGGFGALGSEHGSEFDCPMENEISGGSESDPPGGFGGAWC